MKKKAPEGFWRLLNKFQKACVNVDSTTRMIAVIVIENTFAQINPLIGHWEVEIVYHHWDSAMTR
jgi:hypothetical protein